jgi:hypothetical protein
MDVSVMQYLSILYNMDIRDQNGKSIDIAHIEKP